MTTSTTTPDDIDADFTERLQAFVVTRLVESLGDRNPVYSDPEAAAASVHGRVVAPVTALMSWTVAAKPRGRHGVDSAGRRVFRLEGAAAGSASGQTEAEAAAAKKDEPWGAAVDMREFLKAEGYVAPAVTNGWFEYVRYLVPGERLSVAPVRIDKIAGPKRTGLGLGYFITTSQRVLDVDGEVVAVIRQTMLRAKPYPKEPSATSETKKQPAATEIEGASTDDWAFHADPWNPNLTTVAVGDNLPELIVDLTPSQVIAGAIASQDWAPVHHDVGFATSVGHPNVFLNIQISTGLVGRFITDWAGPDALIETLDIRLGVPSYAGDLMTITGEVTSVESQGERDRLTVAVKATNSIGVHISSTVTVTVPSI
ncbi:MaoC family dehydratase N-terminal domain-containing protein [Rhodococcus sp. T2V]|uniref:FAS1-like dehydratase domain-containing protein n=1 Tax=Rhodococcus sp. T2V TaxID=3034164 RepID=UPI0023E0E96C|nr:MaoC family dehydratase N-terminal domain-containing protein [Rhodococcus sp. T2V]MDF3309660.1 MaoC family dehydratase N-terminal domain-containing protein [Rhodococcus sp. T2V]